MVEILGTLIGWGAGIAIVVVAARFTMRWLTKGAE